MTHSSSAGPNNVCQTLSGPLPRSGSPAREARGAATAAATTAPNDIFLNVKMGHNVGQNNVRQEPPPRLNFTRAQSSKIERPESQLLHFDDCFYNLKGCSCCMECLVNVRYRSTIDVEGKNDSTTPSLDPSASR